MLITNQETLHFLEYFILRMRLGVILGTKLRATHPRMEFDQNTNVHEINNLA